MFTNLNGFDTYSQNTIYEAAAKVLSQLPSLHSVELHMPNIHYFTADLSKLGIANTGEVIICTHTHSM